MTDPRRPRRGLVRTVLGVTAILALAGFALSALPASDPVPGPASSPPQPTAAVPSPAKERMTGDGNHDGPVTSPLHLVGLGDSVMAGVACGCDGITAEMARMLSSRDGRAVADDNLGLPGETVAGLLDVLADDEVRATLRQADYVVVVIGANDLGTLLDSDGPESCDSDCSRPVVATMKAGLTRALRTINQLNDHATVLVDGYWNVFEDGARTADRHGPGRIRWSRELTARANDAIASAARDAGARFVDLAAAFGQVAGGDPTGLLADDGDHPNAAGASVIAGANVAALDRTGDSVGKLASPS